MSTTSMRRQPGEFMKSTLVSGLLVILPLGLVLAIVLHLADMISLLAVPLMQWLPHGLRFPRVVGLLLLFVACLVAGLLAHTRVGRGAGTSLEDAILNRIPGYSIVRSVTRRIGSVEETDRFAPALVELEGNLVPAFVVEEHTDGRYTVFVPSAPTPAVGAIYIMTRERVHIVEAPFLTAVKCVSTWGVGSAELLLSMRQAPQSKDYDSEPNSKPIVQIEVE